jgi:hypothetical protein
MVTGFGDHCKGIFAAAGKTARGMPLFPFMRKTVKAPGLSPALLE